MHAELMDDAFARDRWFPIELSSQVPQGQVVQATLHGQELALWRSGDGELHAWENRCPHRSVRLTLGFIADDQLVCRYHGWRYGGDGRCTGIPSTPALTPPPAACVKRFLCREAGGIVWTSLALTPRGWPPVGAGALTACRSFMLDVGASMLAHRLSQAGFTPDASAVMWREAPDAGNATLLLLPVDHATTCAHLFVDGCAVTADVRVDAARRLKPRLAHWAETAKEPDHAH